MIVLPSSGKCYLGRVCFCGLPSSFKRKMLIGLSQQSQLFQFKTLSTALNCVLRSICPMKNGLQKSSPYQRSSYFALPNNICTMSNKFWIWCHFFHCGLCPKWVLVCIRFSLICTPIDGAGSPYQKHCICRSILKTISKLRDQISLRWQLTSVHSIFFWAFCWNYSAKQN